MNEQQITEIKAETSRFLKQTDWIFQRYLEREALKNSDLPADVRNIKEKREALRERGNLLEKEVIKCQ